MNEKCDAYRSVVVDFSDISIRKKAEEVLRRTKEKLTNRNKIQIQDDRLLSR